MRALLTLLCLLALATSASAESAWVLWAQDGSKPWNLMEAYSTKEACESALKERMEYIKSLKGVTTVGSYAFFGSTVVKHACFPDTIDPRGPKAK